MEIPHDAHTRSVFYCGGDLVADSKGHHTLCGQIYVEHLIPVGKPARPHPIVCIPGASRSSVDFLITTTSASSWASIFLSHNYHLYLIDPSFRGCSPWHQTHPSASPSAYQTFPAELMQRVWTSASASSQFPTKSDNPSAFTQAILAPSFPTLVDTVAQEKATQKGLAALLDKIEDEKVILLAHSRGAPAAWLAADARPGRVAAIVAIEPSGPPFAGLGADGPRGVRTAYGLTNAPITFEPAVEDPDGELLTETVRSERGDEMEVLLQKESDGGGAPRRLVNLVDVSVVVVTSEMSKHKRYDWGTVAFLRQAGVRRVEHVRLEERGIRGNGHMMMVERNAEEVAGEVARWIEEVLGDSRG